MEKVYMVWQTFTGSSKILRFKDPVAAASEPLEPNIGIQLTIDIVIVNPAVESIDQSQRVQALAFQ